MFLRKLLEEELRKEIEVSILLEEKDKSALFRKMSTWPDLLLERALDVIRNKNRRVESYIDAALTSDKGHSYSEKLKKLFHG